MAILSIEHEFSRRPGIKNRIDDRRLLHDITAPRHLIVLYHHRSRGIDFIDEEDSYY